MARARKVDLNAASREELVEVAGLRPAIADAVLKRREERGPFSSIDELTDIPGVGPASVEQIRGNVTVGKQTGEEEREPARAATDTAKAATDTAKAGVEAADEATQRAAGTAREVTESGVEAARRAGEAVVTGSARLAEQGRQQAEEMTELGVKAMGGDPSEFAQRWLAFWTEQSSESFKTMLALGMCRSWQEAIEIQSEFVKSSMQRFNAWAAASMEQAREVTETTARAAQEATASNVERMSRRA
jgi:competence ComEA-like helix-hairpin-helix protein